MSPPALHVSSVTCGNRSLLPASRQCQLPRRLGSPFDTGRAVVLRCAGVTGISTGGERRMDTTQRQPTSSGRRPPPARAAGGRRPGGAPRRPRGVDERHRRRGRASPSPSSTATSATRAASTAPSPSGTPTPCSHSLRAALDAPAERRERVEATLDTYLAAIEARPQVYRFLMHPAEDGHRRGEQGFDVGRHSAPLLRRHGRGAGRGHRGTARPRPGQPAAGPGLGPRHRRHDARGRATGGWANARAPAPSWCAAWPTCCGAGWPRRATRSGGPGF